MSLPYVAVYIYIRVCVIVCVYIMPFISNSLSAPGLALDLRLHRRLVSIVRELRHLPWHPHLRLHLGLLLAWSHFGRWWC